MQILYASDLLYFTATFSARTAVLCLINALSPEYWHTLFTKYCIVLSMLMSVTGVFMIAFGCDVKAPWSQIVDECESTVSLFLSNATVICISLTHHYQYTRWIAITVFGIFLGLAIFGVTLRMLFNLQRRWSGKFKATMVFALRLPCVTFPPE